MNRRGVLVLAVVAAVAAVVSAFDLNPPASAAHVRALAVTQAQITRTKLVCPRVGGDADRTMTVVGGAAAAGSGAVSWGPLTSAHPQNYLTSSGHGVFEGSRGAVAPVVLRATGTIAGHVVVEQFTRSNGGIGRGDTDSSCNSPQSDMWFVGSGTGIGANTQLLLTNVESKSALVDITTFTAAGPVQPRAAQAIPVPDGQQIVVDIGTLAPGEPVISVHVQARQGQVAGALETRQAFGQQPRGVDFVPPAQSPARSIVLVGVPGFGMRTLVVANPGDNDATASVRIVTDQGSFAPTQPHSVAVPAGSVRAVSIDAAFGSEHGAVVVAADQPVLAGIDIAMISTDTGFGDFTWLGAAPAVNGTAVVPIGPAAPHTADFLFVAAPSVGARVQVAAADRSRVRWSRTLTIAAGRCVAIGLPAFPQNSYASAFVTKLSGGPVYATRLIYERGARGPLITSVPAISPTFLVFSPPVIADNSVAFDVGF